MDFGHVGPKAELVATIRVEDLLREDKDLFAVGSQLLTEIISRFHRDIPLSNEDYDKKRILYIIDRVNELKKESKGFHCGDCTNMPVTCTRCQIERLYRKGEKATKIWKSLNPTGTTQELLAVLLATMGDWKSYLNRKGIIPEGDSTAEFFNLTCFAKPPERYQVWQAISEIEKESFRKRASQFRSHF